MNFEVWAPTQADADRIADALEKYYKKFLSDIRYGGMLKKKPSIFIFKNYEDYIKGTGNDGYNTDNTGGIAVKRSAREEASIYSFLETNLETNVLMHELTHLIFKEMVAGLRVDVDMPLWLDEGMATFEEGNFHYKRTVKAALKDNSLIPLKEVINLKSYPKNHQQNLLFYAESASLVDFFITKFGGAKFMVFSKNLTVKKKDITKALYNGYYPTIKNLDDLNGQWLEFIGKY